jgi:Raf kinase inhibitor-like YbhB/YbcL family protein
MRKRCLVVSLASPRSNPRYLAFMALSAAIIIANGPCALAESAFSVTSVDLHPESTVPEAQVFNQGDCKGGNQSPQLSWRNVPTGTRSFAITMFDPDSPGPGWWSWAVAGIPAHIHQLPANASASGYLKKLGAIEARNDFDTDGYGGPCPAPGKPHRYVITVYALSVTDPQLADGRPALMFDHEIGMATLGSARLVVTYGR